MPLVKSITPKIINVLGGRWFAISLILTAFTLPATAQDNSPYSRYGLGDLVPNTNINTRAMGGISAGYTDIFSINYNNPASFSAFQAIRQQTSKKLASGRAIFDAGINLESRTLREPNNIGKFTASNALFSHIQVGVPLRPNWGLSFGLRPISRISYNIVRNTLLTDPNTGLPIDSAFTTNEGDGGSYLVSAGTGFKFEFGKDSSNIKRHAIAFGINGGYYFGKKDYANRLAIQNDSLLYNAGNFQTRTTYGDIQLTGGLQYTGYFKRTNEEEFALTIGAFGNLKTDLNARRDIIRETYIYDPSSGYNTIDSVWSEKDVKGIITYPTNITTGFVLERKAIKKVSWLIGVDYIRQNWDEFMIYGEKDPTLRSKSEIRVGGQIRPVQKASYFSNVAYRLGFFFGDDYIQVQNEKIPVFGATLGFELPFRKFNRQQMYQETKVNLAFEFIRRGNNNNLLKENQFRLSAGFALSDFWFIKRKFD
jgi:hypothetical protein